MRSGSGRGRGRGGGAEPDASLEDSLSVGVGEGYDGIMPSPFPGMDPYLEDPAVWPDFHHTFITFVRTHLLDRLPPAYDAGVEKRVGLEVVEGWPVEQPHRRKAGEEWVPDLTVDREKAPGRWDEGRGGAGGTAVLEAVEVDEVVATLEPATLPVLVEVEVKQGYIEVRRHPERELVTVVEVLSPSNKVEPGLTVYLQKREELMGAGDQPGGDRPAGGGRAAGVWAAAAGGGLFCVRVASGAADGVRCVRLAAGGRVADGAGAAAVAGPGHWARPGGDDGETYERGRFERRMRYEVLWPTVGEALGEEHRRWAAGVVTARVGEVGVSSP